MPVALACQPWVVLSELGFTKGAEVALLLLLVVLRQACAHAP